MRRRMHNRRLLEELRMTGCAPMFVEVELFATLRKDRLPREPIELQSGSRVTDLLTILGITVDDVMILVVNQKDATFEQVLNEGDTVTIIPPIGGG